tara:strand:- start:60 stop:1709 length:1650 start_codon:yes stop_codon:yes gene_type:complete
MSMTVRRSKEDLFLLTFLIVLCVYHIVARFGLAVDLQWHTDVGRDKLLTPPHLMIFAGILPTAVFLGGYLIWNSFYKPEKVSSDFKLGPLYAPASIWMMCTGMFTLTIGGLFDDYWHASYGVDTTIITPPHVWTFAGGMLVEAATLVLALELKHKMKEQTPHWINIIVLGTLWALVYHFHLAFANFLDPRVSTLDVFDFQLILHFVFAGAVLMTFLPLGERWLGKHGVLRLSGVMLGSQVLFLVLVPFLVTSFMTEEHVLRPGAPHTTYAANCLPWLLFPAVFFVSKFTSITEKKILIPLVLAVDVAWLPTFIEHTPVEVGILNTVLSVLLSAAILWLIWPITQGFGPAIERLALRTASQGAKPDRKKKAVSLVVLMLVLLCMSAPLASAHAIHLSEEGDGFDAPMRYLIDVNDTYVWVEFMMWPPKAKTVVEVSILPAENESTVIDDVWLTLVYPDERGEVKMKTLFENPGGYGLWESQVNFPYAGDQTIEIWLEVDGVAAFTEIPVDVASPPSLPVWLAWFIALAWPTAFVLMWRRISLLPSQGVSA